jgi:hypothetical protein
LGDVQDAKAPLSSEHSNVEDSVALNVNVADVDAVGPLGPESIVVSGGVVSGASAVVNDQLTVDASGLPAASVTPPDPLGSVAVYVVAGSRAAVGSSVAVCVVASYVTLAATAGPPLGDNVNELDVNDEASIASENVAATFVDVCTLPAPSAGETACTVGAVRSTAHVRLAGVGSTFPAASRARTWNVCAPPVTVYVFGVVHEANVPLSSEHSNVADASSAENVKVAVVEEVVPVGPESIVVSGAPVSTVTCTADELADLLPAVSVAVAVSEC